MQQFKIGDRVRVRQDAGLPWAGDWRDVYVVTGAQLRYQRHGRIDYSIATPDEIEHKLGDTDGFYDEHLVAT